MKTRFLHIVISSLLLGNLLFTQVVLNFFHTHHSENTSEEATKEYPAGTKLLHTSVEKCQVCSLNIVHELFYHEAFRQEAISSYVSACFYFEVVSIATTFFDVSGRGPPLV